MATIGDVIAAKKAADLDVIAKQAAAVAADAAYATAQATIVDANATLKADLLVSGPVFTLDPSVTPPVVEIWLPDGSDVGFSVFRPLDASVTPVPPAPTP